MRLGGPQSQFEYCGEEKHLLLLPEIEPRVLGGSDRRCTDRAIRALLFWLEKSISESFLFELVVFLTFIWRAPVRITAGTPTVLIESFRGFTQSLPANNGTLLENESRPSPHALPPYIIATLKKSKYVKGSL
jgi:hypothetical protein